MGNKYSFLFILVMLVGACSKPEKKEPVITREINELPHLTFKNLDGSPATTRELPGKTILILFNTDCDHCQREARAIQENLSAFKDYTLQFIAAEAPTMIQKFAQDYDLVNQPNIRFGQAESVDVYLNFGSIPTPAIYIYSDQRKLVKSFLGETPVAQIVSYL